MAEPRPAPSFAILLQRFLGEHLTQHRAASPRTVAAYRDTFRLLLLFVEQHIGKAPMAVALADLDAQWSFAGTASGTAPPPGNAACPSTSLADWCAALDAATTLPGPRRLCGGAGSDPGWTLVWRGGSCVEAGEHQRSRRFVW